MKKLCREYDSLVSNAAQYKKKVNSLLNLVFPKFNEIFSDIFSSVPLTILFKYPIYVAFLSANKSDVIALITSTVNYSTEWVDKRYNLLFEIAKEAELLKLDVDCVGTEMVCFINLINSFKISINKLKERILEFYKNKEKYLHTVKCWC